MGLTSSGFSHRKTLRDVETTAGSLILLRVAKGTVSKATDITTLNKATDKDLTSFFSL